MVRWLRGNDVLVSGHQLLDFVLILLISLGKCASCPWSCSPSTAHQAPSLPPASPSHPDDLQPDLTVLLRATSQLCLGCVGCGQQSKLVVQIAIDHVEFNLVCYHRHCQLVHFIFELSPHQKQLVIEEGAIWNIRPTTNGWVRIDWWRSVCKRLLAGTVCSTERSNL